MATKRLIQSLLVVWLILISIPVAQAQEPEAGEGWLGYGDVITEEAITQAHLADLLNTIEGILSGRVFMYDSGSGWGSDLSSLLGG